MGTKEFLEFKQTIRELEKQVEMLVRETAENGPSKENRGTDRESLRSGRTSQAD
jgi:hypothetical protein